MSKIQYLTQKKSGASAKIKDRRDRAMFKLMYDFGLRVSEVGKLILKGLDLERRVSNIEGIYIP